MTRTGKRQLLMGACVAIGLFAGEARAFQTRSSLPAPNPVTVAQGNLTLPGFDSAATHPGDDQTSGLGVGLLGDSSVSFHAAGDDPMLAHLPEPTAVALMGVGGLLLIAPYLRRKTRHLGRITLD